MRMLSCLPLPQFLAPFSRWSDHRLVIGPPPGPLRVPPPQRPEVNLWSSTKFAPWPRSRPGSRTPECLPPAPRRASGRSSRGSCRRPRERGLPDPPRAREDLGGSQRRRPAPVHRLVPPARSEVRPTPAAFGYAAVHLAAVVPAIELAVPSGLHFPRFVIKQGRQPLPPDRRSGCSERRPRQGPCLVAFQAAANATSTTPSPSRIECWPCDAAGVPGGDRRWPGGALRRPRAASTEHRRP